MPRNKNSLRICFRIQTTSIYTYVLPGKRKYILRIFVLYFFCTERINTDKPGVMSDVGFCKYNVHGSGFSIQPVKLIGPFTDLFTCDRVLIDAVQQCRYRYILQLRRYCSVYFYEMELPKNEFQSVVSFNPALNAMPSHNYILVLRSACLVNFRRAA